MSTASERAKDELPQSGSGRTVMTSEPKFVPEEAVDIALDEGASCSVRLIDCVGYMVPRRGGTARRTTVPAWSRRRGPTIRSRWRRLRSWAPRAVIREHSTIGIVITTDGSITDIPREDYLEAEGAGHPGAAGDRQAFPRAAQLRRPEIKQSSGHGQAILLYTMSVCCHAGQLPGAGRRRRWRISSRRFSTSSRMTGAGAVPVPAWVDWRCPRTIPSSSVFTDSHPRRAPSRAAPHPGGRARRSTPCAPSEDISERKGHRYRRSARGMAASAELQLPPGAVLSDAQRSSPALMWRTTAIS